MVLDDADVDAAVNAAIFGCYMNQGQICMSTERLIVDDSIADEFARKFAARAAELPAGDPRGHVVLGALCLPGAGERMDELIADARARGGKVLAGGTRDGAVVAATVIDTLPNGVLHIQGSQEVRVNYEVRELTVSGFVRPTDISRDNEVAYDRIAGARISYGGHGQISDVQQPRYGQQLADIVLPY